MHLDRATLEAGVDHVRESPRDEGTVELICRRPQTEEREVLDEVMLDEVEGMVGDNWSTRGSSSTEDGSSNPEMQLTLMNARSAMLVAGTDDRRQLAGDQLFVDLDLSEGNLPPGTRIQIGDAVVERTAIPHRGCGKFLKRFGA